MTVNPVLRRELIERWRGRRAFVVVTVYVAILALVMLLLYWVGLRVLDTRSMFGGADVGAGPALGRFLFENLLAFVLLLVLFIAPGYAAAQISGERERRTLGLLQVTLVRPHQIALGKLGAATAWLLLLVVAAVPFGAAAFFLGGVSLADLLRGLATVVLVAVSVAAVGLGISSLTRRTTAAMVVTYGLVLVLVLGTLFGALVESAVRRFDFGVNERPVALFVNPFYGLADAVRADGFRFGFGGELPSVLTPFGAALPHSFEEFAGPQPVDDGVVLGDVGPAVREQRRTPVWLITLGICLGFGTAGLLLATRRVRVGHGPRRRRPPPDRVVTAGGDGPGPSSPTSPPPGAPPPPPAQRPPADRGSGDVP